MGSIISDLTFEEAVKFAVLSGATHYVSEFGFQEVGDVYSFFAPVTTNDKTGKQTYSRSVYYVKTGNYYPCVELKYYGERSDVRLLQELIDELVIQTHE